jgi:asparagine synthase (glutamine-hydrolysing)
MAEEKIIDSYMANARYRSPCITPVTAEAYFYQEIFEPHFPGEAAAACVPCVDRNTPIAIAWKGSFTRNMDPSDPALMGIHKDAK